MSETTGGEPPLDDGGTGGVTTHRARRPHRRRRIILISLGAVLLLVIGVATAGYIYLDRSIQTFSPAGIDKHRPKDTKATDILIIGTDARGGENTKLGGSGDAIGRSDTTILVHVYPGGKSAVGLSIPRDTLVTIPHCRLPDGSWSPVQKDTMFNAAFSVGESKTGNPTCTINTVERLTHLHVDHTIIANFAGFAAMSKAVGGVPVCLPNAVYAGDLNPNLGYQGNLVFKAGVQKVEGAKALQYVRVRHGIGDGSDIGRIKRQQAFLSSLISTIKAKGLEPGHILPLVHSATKTLTFDSALNTPVKLFSFAKHFLHISTKNIDFVTMPWRYDGARVAIVQPAANDLFAALRADEPITGKTTIKKKAVPRGSGTVSVLNGTYTDGLAARIATRLTTKGWTATAGNYPTRGATQTLIEYAPADAARAKLMARYLDAKLVPDSTVKTLTVVLGSSHKWLATTKARRLPASVTENIRKATANICSDLTYG
jgi:LCP family protein required for cell wall assembly